ncbi:MAG: nitroreductase family protein [Verrucomicrobia bacterium]|nr:nitroreductase family protein [Verrucomicrobiota bacterium]
MSDGRDAVQHVLGRHSAREYTGEPVDPADVDVLMEALRWAPSAGNVQPWFFYVVTNPGVRAALAKAAYGQTFVEKAPLMFVVCADPELSAVTYRDRGRELYCMQDTAAAVENLLVVAHMLGYGACWVGAFDEKKACDALDVPDHLRPVAIVPVGPARPIAHHPGRRPAETLFKIVT